VVCSTCAERITAEDVMCVCVFCAVREAEWCYGVVCSTRDCGV